MSYEKFLQEARERNLRLPVDSSEAGGRLPQLDNEALFQLPFLAMTILAISKGTRKPSLSEIGQLVGECLEATMVGFKGSSQHIGWSANLRIRTVKALTFLEASNLTEINQRTQKLHVTEKGRQVLDRAIENSGDLADAIHMLERNHRNITREAQIRLEV